MGSVPGSILTLIRSSKHKKWHNKHEIEAPEAIRHPNKNVFCTMIKRPQGFECHSKLENWFQIPFLVLESSQTCTASHYTRYPEEEIYRQKTIVIHLLPFPHLQGVKIISCNLHLHPPSPPCSCNVTAARC